MPLRSGLKRGQRVLIHGGSGVIGSCAVQLARSAGAIVVATASASQLERVRSLGAHQVLDYRQSYESEIEPVDLVVDTVGGETRERSWALLRAGGCLATLVPPAPEPPSRELRAFMVHGHPDIGLILPDMTERLESGSLAPPGIAGTYPLSEAAAAHAEYARSSPRGRIVLLV